MKTKIKFNISIFILLILVLLFGGTKQVSAIENNGKLEILFEDATLNVNNVSIDEFSSNLALNFGNYEYQINIYAKSTSKEEILLSGLAFDMDIPNSFSKFELTEFVSSKDGRSSIWNSTIPNSTNNKLLSLWISDNLTHISVKNEKVLIGTIFIAFLDYNPNETILPSGFEISQFYDDSIQSSHDVTYYIEGQSNQGQFSKDELVFTPLTIGDPNAGPDASLKALEVKGLNKNYTTSVNETGLVYTTANISYADSKNNNLIITPKPTKAGAKITYDSTHGLKSDYINGDKVIFTVEDDTESKTYTINIVVDDANSDATLKDIIVTPPSAGEVTSKDFDEANKTYNVSVSYSTTQLEITPELNNELSNLDITKLNFTGLQSKVTQTKKVVVTAEDGTTQTYTINVTRDEPNDDASITISVDNEVLVKDTINNIFSKEILENKNSFQINITGVNKASTVTYELDNGQVINLNSSGMIDHTSINKGQTVKYTIYVKTQANKTTEYIVEVTREKSSNLNVSSISVTENENGTSSSSGPILKPLNNVYTHQLIYDDATLIFNGIGQELSTITFKDKDNKIVTEIQTKDLAFGDHEFTILITAQNGITSESKLILKKLSNQKDLMEIYLHKGNDINGNLIAEGITNDSSVNDKFLFDQKDNYSIKLKYEDISNFYLKLVSSSRSIIEVNGSKQTDNISTLLNEFKSSTLDTIRYNVKIYDEKSNNSSNPNPKVITISITREAANTDNKLETIKINQKDIENFNANTNNYGRQISVTGTTSVNVEGILPANSLATLEIYVNNNLHKSNDIGLNGIIPVNVEIRVTSQAGTINTYTFTLLAGSDENEIKSIQLSNIELYNFGLVYNPLTKVYNLNVPFSVKNVTIDATASNNASIFGKGNFALKQGINTYSIYATSELNTKGEVYSINITQEAGRTNNTLDNLEYFINGDSYEVSLQNGIFNYEADNTFNRGTKTIKITAGVNQNEGKKIEGNNSYTYTFEQDLKPGINIITVAVISEVGVRQEYKLTIIIADDNVEFDKVILNNIEYTLDNFNNEKLIIETPFLFDSGNINFDVLLRSEFSKTNITLTNNGTYIESTNEIVLNIGTTIITFYVIAENKDESTKYTIELTKLAANKLSNVEELIISDGTNEIYNNSKLNGDNVINLRVDRNIENITITANLLTKDISKISGLTLLETNSTLTSYKDIKTLSNAGSISVIRFEVIAEDGVTKSTYTINIVRKNIDSKVNNLVIKKGNVELYNGNYEDFVLGEFLYNDNEVTFIITLNDPSSRVFLGNTLKLGNGVIVEFNVNLIEGLSNKINLSVKTDLLSTDNPNEDFKSNDIVISYDKKAARSTAQLDSLLITYDNNNEELIEYVSGDTIPQLISNLNIIRDFQSVTIAANAKDGGKVSGVGTSFLNVGANKEFIITVEAENGTKFDYKITISNKNIDNNITDILIDNESISFKDDVYIYDLTNTPYKYDKDSINIDVTTDEFASVFNSGNIKLDYKKLDGINEFIIYATSELGVKGSEYKLIVKIDKPYENINLSDLIVKDDLGNTILFDNGVYTSGKYDYQIKLNETQVIPSINIFTTLLNVDKQQISGDFEGKHEITYNVDGTLNKTFKFLVSAENNKEQEYTITLSKGVVLSNANSILTLDISNTTNFTYNKDTLLYEDIKVPFGTKVVSLNATSSDKSIITGNKEYTLNTNKETVITVYATSESGIKGNEYVIKITHSPASTFADLLELEVRNSTVGKTEYLLGLINRNPNTLFEPNTKTYVLNLGIEYSGRQITIVAHKGHDGQVIKYPQGETPTLNYGKNTFIIEVTPEDTSVTPTTYSVIINVFNKDNDINNVTFNTDSIDSSTNVLEYTTEEKTVIYIFDKFNNGKVIIKDINNQVMSGNLQLEHGLNKFILEVFNEYDELVKTYNIEITKESSTNNLLDSLVVNTNVKNLLNESIDLSNNTYYYQVDETNTTVTINYVLKDGQTVTSTFNSGDTLNLIHGLNTFTILVYAEDLSVEPYLYTIEIEVISSNANIDKIFVDNIDINYVSNISNYQLDAVSSDTTNVQVLVNPVDFNSTVEIKVDGVIYNNGLVPLIPGNNIIKINVTSEDGKNTKEVVINIEQLLETNNELIELNVVANNLNYLLGNNSNNPTIVFDSKTNTYNIEVNELIESITMNYIASSNKQTVLGLFNQELNINHGLNTFKVTVEPEDPASVKNIYTININKTYSFIELDELYVDGYNILEPNIYEYILESVTTDKQSIKIEPILSNKYGKYLITDNEGKLVTNNNVPLSLGTNNITITLTSEDNSQTIIYKINVEQVLSNDNEIYNMEVLDASTNVNKIYFETETLTYEVNFNYSTEKAIILLDANSKSKIYINNIVRNRFDVDLLDGKTVTVTVYVESEDKTKGQEYTINLYRRSIDEGSLSDNNKLSNLKLEIPMEYIDFNFNPLTTDYLINVPYEAFEVYLKGYPEHKGALVHNEGAYSLNVGLNDPIYIRVQAEDGTLSKTRYKVIFNRENPNSDTTLKNLIVEDLNGNILPLDSKFDPDKKTYTIKVEDNSTINTVRIKTTKKHISQSVFGDGVLSLYGELEGQYNTVLPVTVVAQDGTSSEYVIYVLHDLDFSNIIEVKDISVIGDDRVSYFGLEFDSKQFNYEINVPFNVLETRLIVQTLGNVIYLDQNNKEIEDNRLQQFDSTNKVIYKFKIQSINEQNESGIYEIIVNRNKANSNALLESLKIDGNDIIGFNPLVNNYQYIQYILDSNLVDVLGKAEESTSTVNGNKTYTLIEGNSIFVSIVVTAQDNTTNTYTIEIKYVNSNALLGELSIYEIDEFGNEFQIQLSIEPNKFNYQVSINRNINKINVKGSAKDQGGARIRGFGQYNITNTDLIIPITVTSGDLLEERVYFITVSKNMRGDAGIENIFINSGVGDVIYDFTNPYRINKETTNLSVKAKTKDNNAKVYFNGVFSETNTVNLNDIVSGQTSISVRVESEDGQVVETYIVNIVKEYEPDMLLTILLILSLILWIATILILIIKKNRKKQVDNNQLIF